MIRRGYERLRGLFKGREEFELTEGGIGWPLFYLSLPIVITNLLQTAYNLADTFWLGRYSTEALAAISFSFPMVFLLIALGMGLSVAGSVLVAQHTGADQPRQAEYAASQTVTFSLLGSLLLGGIGFFVVEDLLRIVGAEPAVLPGATAYMQVVSAGLVFMFGFFVFISLMRGYGDTLTPMVVMFGTVVLNIVIDPFLIFGWWVFPELGIQGAAVATVFSRSLAMVVGLAIMFGGARGIAINLRDMRPDFGYLPRLLRIGLPASVEGTGRALSINLLMVIVGTFSTTIVAAFGIGIRVFSVIFLPAIAVARGVETMSAQNIGAGHEDRAAATNHFAAKTMFLVLTGIGVVTFFAAPAIASVFTPNPAVIDITAWFLRVVALTFGFTGIMRAYVGGIRGAGKTMTAAAIAIVTMAFIRLPVAFVGATNWGTDGLFASFVVSNVVGAIVAYLWFRRGTWREVDLTEDGTPADIDETLVEGEADAAGSSD
ncbi:MAG: MATE family efflux transporter [Haloarculaceae archaeon]